MSVTVIFTDDPWQNRRNWEAAFAEARIRDKQVTALSGFCEIAGSPLIADMSIMKRDGIIRIPAGVKVTLPPDAVLKRHKDHYGYVLFANESFDVDGSADVGYIWDGGSFDGGADDWAARVERLENRIGWTEHLHCLGFFGTQKPGLFRTRFEKMIGDGLVIGRTFNGWNYTEQPRNYTHDFLYFDGELRNRNGVTVTSLSGFEFGDSCVYKRCARPNMPVLNGELWNPAVHLEMPAAIDLEPDNHGRLVELIEDGYIGGEFYENKSDVWMVAQWENTHIRRVQVNIWTDRRRYNDINLQSANDKGLPGGILEVSPTDIIVRVLPKPGIPVEPPPVVPPTPQPEPPKPDEPVVTPSRPVPPPLVSQKGCLLPIVMGVVAGIELVRYVLHWVASFT